MTTDARSWMDRVAAGLLPEVRRPEAGDPVPLELLNLLREAQGLPAQSYAEYIAAQQDAFDAMTDAERAESAESLAALLDKARARVALEQAFLREQPSTEWI